MSTSSETAASSEASPSPSPARRPSALRRTVELLLGSERIRRARASLPVLTQDQQTLLSRARLAGELADRTIEPADPWKHGSGTALALDLYRQGIYWALLSRDPGLGRPGFGQLWSASGQALAALGLPPDELREQGTLLSSEPSFVAHGDMPEPNLRPAAEQARALLQRLLDAQDAPALTLLRLRIARAVRISLLLVLAGGLAWFLVTLAIPKKVDLAKGKPWTTSSMFYPCDVEKGECGGTKTRIFFHTKEEQNPWFEYDLGAPTHFSSLTIRNRSDCCADRAVPLVVEVSNDRISYRELARQRTTFSVWKPKLEPQVARYVRLRVLRYAYFHLEEFQVHP